MTYPFVQAKHFTAGRGGHTPRMIVIHTMETPETEGRAKQVAAWFAGSTAPEASAHYCVDDKDIITSINRVFQSNWQEQLLRPVLNGKTLIRWRNWLS